MTAAPPSALTLRAMHLRRGGLCACGHWIAAGEPAGWDPVALAPVCLGCLGAVPAPRDHDSLS